jgi:cyclic pyranopterin phosphate synthase
VFAGITAARQAGLAPIRLNCVVEEDSSEADAQDVARFAADSDVEVRFIRRIALSEGRFAAVEGGLGGECPRCNRLRLASDGSIRPCLLSNLCFRVRELGATEALTRAIRAKPQSGSACTDRSMNLIGG